MCKHWQYTTCSLYLICRGTHLCLPATKVSDYQDCSGCWIYLSRVRTKLKIQIAKQIKILNCLILQSLPPSQSPEHSLTNNSYNLLLLCSSVESQARSMSLHKCAFLKVVEMGASDHIADPVELRQDPICLRKERKIELCRVWLMVASDLNLVVWSVIISHLVGGVTRSKLWQPSSYTACFIRVALFCWEFLGRMC